jgi:hypothetical protein
MHAGVVTGTASTNLAADGMPRPWNGGAVKFSAVAVRIGNPQLCKAFDVQLAT